MGLTQRPPCAPGDAAAGRPAIDSDEPEADPRQRLGLTHQRPPPPVRQVMLRRGIRPDCVAMSHLLEAVAAQVSVGTI